MTPRNSIRRRVTRVVFIASLLALVCAGIGILIHERLSLRTSAKVHLQTLSQMLEASLYGSVDFNDRTTATESLRSLQATQDIISAHLELTDGTVFAAFERGPTVRSVRPAMPEDGFYYESIYRATYASTLYHAGEPYGRLLLVSNLQLARVGLNVSLWILGGILAVLIPTAFGLGVLLQRAITRPLLELTGVVQHIRETGDYAQRALVRSGDEIGQLAEGFNEMLAAIEEKQANLRVSEERFRDLIEHAPDAILVIDVPRMRFIDCNPEAERLFGRSRAQLLRLGPSETSPPLQADGQPSVDRARELVGESLRTGEVTFEWLHSRPDGTQVPCEIRLLRLPHREQSLLRVSIIDITERKRAEAERERLLSELEQKNKELESIVYVASHDLRSPLVNILGFSERLERHLHEVDERVRQALPTSPELQSLRPLLDERIPNALRFIGASGTKMDALINGLLRLSRTGRAALHPENIHLEKLMQSIIDAQKFQLESCGAQVEVGPIPACHGDPLQINQVFANLIDNAIKYRSPERPLKIRIQGHRAGPRTVCVIEDNGGGIDREHQDKIWELFHRLDPNGKVAGEGLGLTLVRRIVERHRGSIHVESELGKGSRFIVELPATGSAATPLSPTP